MQRDLNLARRRLEQKNLALVVVQKNKVIFETNEIGIYGLLNAIKTHGKNMINSSVADKILGKAAAFLLVLSRVKAVFAIIASNDGIRVLTEHQVPLKFKERVAHILDSKKMNICPFEQLVTNISTPQEAYEQLNAFCLE